MDTAASARTGKGAGDENFPVASWLISACHRPAILAFYDFVRTADDVADHPTLPPSEKVRLLDQLETGLIGNGSAEAVALPLRSVLDERNITPQHALDLLAAFRVDIHKTRYENWDELIDYCRLSAMPVGRYVLDVHGESQALWPANDALCAALQIINHLQDCAKDYRVLDRVYVPLDAMKSAGTNVGELASDIASPALRRCLSDIALKVEQLLDEAGSFSWDIRDRRLSLEVAVIHGLADRLVHLLQRRDPLSERVHIGKLGAFSVLIGVLARRMRGNPRRVGSAVRLSI